MTDTKMYTQLLALPDPWYIARIDVDVAGKRSPEIFVMVQVLIWSLGLLLMTMS